MTCSICGNEEGTYIIYDTEKTVCFICKNCDKKIIKRMKDESFKSIQEIREKMVSKKFGKLPVKEQEKYIKADKFIQSELEKK